MVRATAGAGEVVDQPITVPWLLIRKEPLPNSWGKDIAAKKEHVGGFPGERLVLPGEFAYAAILHGLATGGKLARLLDPIRRPGG